MTPISTLTNDELDRLIAERRGVEITWHPDGKRHFPAYATDPRAAFELLEEMAKYDGDDGELAPSINYLVGNQSWEIHIYKHDWIEAKDLKRAIAEVWLEWKGGE